MVETISEIIQRISPYYKKKKGPEAEHKLVYDSAAETLEPIYFFILDLMGDFGLKTEKMVDNFTSAPGSSHFAELNQRAGIIQQQATKTLGDINTVLRSVLNLIYDLKDFKMRLRQYDDLKSNETKEAATLSLKQLWMDKVDAMKGNSSIKAMALGQAGFVTLINAFLAAKDSKEAEKLDLNDQVKRIVIPRIHEFNIWVKESEIELRKRYELEKNYLRSQVSSLKLYSRWAKPYLKASQALEQKETGRSADLVKTFNTILLELTLLGKSKIDIKSTALAGDLPDQFTKNSFIKTLKRDYHVCVLVDFYFRGIPQKVGQQGQYAFGGKVEVNFKAYVLNDDELKKLNKELEKSDLGDVLELIEGATTDSLGKLQDEIDEFLEEKETVEKKKSEGSNPFLALIGMYGKKEEKPKEKKEDKDKPVKKDSWTEAEFIRSLAAQKAADQAFNLFNTYKKAHGMPTFI
jgi:flavodoxin